MSDRLNECREGNWLLQQSGNSPKDGFIALDFAWIHFGSFKNSHAEEI